jgi:cell division septation protein DedD
LAEAGDSQPSWDVYPYEPQPAEQQDYAISPEPTPELAWEAPQENPAAPRSGDYSITLVPAEERPPRPYSELPPNAEIPPIASAAQIRVAPVDEAGEIPEEFIIPEIARDSPRNSTSGTLTGTIEEYPASVARAPVERAVEPVQILEPTASFSAPVISSLEKGKYYLQLGAFSKPDLVESALTRIGGAYPLAVQAGGSPERPLYRILVGPVNLGESSALLQRFKGNGYRDAFVRQDG